jgi:betaine-aldehyde dehydrogenase
LLKTKVHCAIRNTANRRSLMPDLFIDGRCRAPIAGGSREIRCPADGTSVAE